jgi:hypothetical protein
MPQNLIAGQVGALTGAADADLEGFCETIASGLALSLRRSIVSSPLTERFLVTRPPSRTPNRSPVPTSSVLSP